MNGNLQNFGDFDTCMSLKVPDDIFRGKLCLSSIMFEVKNENFVDAEKFNEIKLRILAGNFFISEFKDVSRKISKNLKFVTKKKL